MSDCRQPSVFLAAVLFLKNIDICLDIEYNDGVKRTITYRKEVIAMGKKTTRWIVVAVVAAVIAAITTMVVLALRARAKKKKAWYEETAFDYDVDECECFDDIDTNADELSFTDVAE